MRLIDADALEEGKFHSIENWTPVERASWQWGWNDAIDAITNNAPTVDADPVRHGHWLNHWVGLNNDYLVFMCDQCKCINNGRTKYCPCCGAKMEGEDETD